MRRYLGVTITSKNYREILKKGGRNLINFHTKHLHSYLMGYEYFFFGLMRNKDGEVTGRQLYKVEQEYTKD